MYRSEIGNDSSLEGQFDTRFNVMTVNVVTLKWTRNRLPLYTNIVPSLLWVFPFFSYSTERHSSVVQHTARFSVHSHLDRTSLESIVFSETSVVITVILYSYIVAEPVR